MSELASALKLHRLPPVLLGSGRTSLMHKLAAAMHACFLESGTKLTLQRMASDIVSLTSDLGVEFGLPAVQPVRVDELLPWMAADSGGLATATDPNDMEALPDCEDHVHLNSSLATPGMLHILHNASNSLLSVMHSLNAAVDQLSEVARLIRTPETCKRLCESCYADEVGQCHHAVLKAFSGNVHRERWGTIAHCTSGVLALKHILVSGWDKEKYMGAQSSAQAGAVHVDTVDAAVTSKMFWASLGCLELLMRVVRRCIAWVEGCPCHHHLADADVAPSLARAWEQCPLRGRRLPEISAGDFSTTFSELFANMIVMALAAIPKSLSSKDRASLLQDLAAGRAHLAFQLTLKVSALRQPPWLLYATAHHSAMKARDALRQCLHSASPHAKIRELKTGTLAEEAREFLDGGDLHDLPVLAEFIGSFKFAFAVERLVEGDHAAIHRAYGRARNHSEAYDSLVRRFPEIKVVIAQPSGFQAMCDNIELCRTPKRAVHALNMGRHESCQRASSGWDVIYRQIVYRADPYTLYHQPYPKVRPAVAPTEPAAFPEPPRPHAPADAPMQPAAPLPSGAVGAYGRLKQASAAKFFTQQLQEHVQSQTRYIYSMPLHSGAVRTLQSLLAVEGKLLSHGFSSQWWADSFVSSGPLHHDEQHVALALDAAAMDRTFWMSVVAAAPSRAKRAQTGRLESSDVGLAFHRALAVNRVSRQVVVALDPVNMRVAADDIDASPLVMSPTLVDLERLLLARAWEATGGLRYSFDHAAEPLVPQPPQTLGENIGGHLHKVLERLSDQEGDCLSSLDPGARAVADGILKHYVAHGLVELHIEAGERKWSLTDDGRARLLIGMVIAHPRNILVPRDVPPREMSVFELLTVLEAQEFECHGVATKEERKEARRCPYIHGGGKLFYIDSERMSNANINRAYLVLLATAEAHGNKVPHLASSSVYASLLRKGQPAQKPCKRRRVALKTFAEPDDEWDVPDFSSAPIGRRRRQTRRRALEPRRACLSESQGGASSKAESHDDSSEPQEEAQESSSSSASSASPSAPSSSSSSPNRAEIVQPAASQGEEHQLPRRVGRRNMYVAEPYGLCRITPRMDPDGNTCGWQMSCMHPSHRGGALCQKTLSMRVAGDERTALTMLKTWITLGVQLPSKASHVAAWADVLRMKAAGELPTEAQLDAQAPLSWD